MTVSCRLIDRGELEAHRGEILAVHRRAFSQWPHDIPEEEFAEFGEDLLDLADRTGFRCVGAFESESANVVGFALGWTVEPGVEDYWRDPIWKALGSNAAREWLMDSFAFALIATDPKWQAQGIGGRLHDELLDGVPHRRAVLSTLQEDSPARKLFRSRGWQALLSDLAFREGGRAFLVMGYPLRSS